jgi:PAS domain S-box-containing protein
VELIDELERLRRAVASYGRESPSAAAGAFLEPVESRLTVAQLRDLTDSLPHLVWTCVADGPCDYLSRQWVEYTGVPEAQQLGFRWLEQLHPDDRDRVVKEWTATVGAEKSFDIEFRIRRADGVHRWFKTRAIPLRDEAGRLVKWYGSNTDMEDFKAAMQELMDKNEQLSRAVEQRASSEKMLAASMRQLESQAQSLREANEQIRLELRERERVEAERREQERVIAAQRDTLLELSAPIIPISEGILVMPLIGVIDAERSKLILDTALRGATELRASHFIIDVTGIKTVDSTAAALVINTARGLELLGARAIITGISPPVAQTFVQLSLNFNGMITEATVQAGLKRALASRW